MRSLKAGAIDALQPPQFPFLGGYLGCGVLVQLASLCLWHMPVGQGQNRERLPASEGTAEADLISFAKLPVWLAALAVDFHLATLAGALSF